MTKTKKLFRLTVYGGYSVFRNELKTMGVTFKERDTFSVFWGIEFLVEKPHGKGANGKIDKLYNMGFHLY